MHSNSATRVVDSLSLHSTPPNAVPQPFQNVVVEDCSLPSWTALVVSESEESMDELSPHAKETHPSKARGKMPQELQKSSDHDPLVTVPRQKVQRASSSGVYSASRDSPGPTSLQEVLQATFNANGSHTTPPPVKPVESEGSYADVTVVRSKRRLMVQRDRRSTSEQSDTALAAPIPNATTGIVVPRTVPRKVAPIPYESLQGVIDAALDTRVATITWCRPRSITMGTTQRVSHDATASAKRTSFADAIFRFDSPTAAHQRDDDQKLKSETHSIEDGRRALPRKLTRMLDRIRPAAGSWQSHGEKFNERLYAMFGDPPPPPPSPPLSDMNERLNRIRINIDMLVSKMKAAREPREQVASTALSPILSSGSPSSNTSLTEITEATSVASDRHDVSKKRTYSESHLGEEHVMKKQKIQIDEDQILEWVTALQRLVKGKAKIDHKVWDTIITSGWIQLLTKYQGMAHLSVVLAEIESVYPHIDSKLAQVSQLYKHICSILSSAHLRSLVFKTFCSSWRNWRIFRSETNTTFAIVQRSFWLNDHASRPKHHWRGFSQFLVA
jgi:hypothetical protein